MTERTEPIAPEEDDIYRPYVEEVLGIEMDNLTFEKIAWYISDQWLDHVMEGPPDHRDKVYEMTVKHTKYLAYLLRNDLNRAKHGDPYPRPITSRTEKVWKAAQTLYLLEDPSGFLGPSLGEIVYVARAIVIAENLGIDTGFDGDTIFKLKNSSIWPWGEIEDDDFYRWVQEGGLYSMFEHRGDDYVDDNFMAQTNVQGILP